MYVCKKVTELHAEYTVTYEIPEEYYCGLYGDEPGEKLWP